MILLVSKESRDVIKSGSTSCSQVGHLSPNLLNLSKSRFDPATDCDKLPTSP